MKAYPIFQEVRNNVARYRVDCGADPKTEKRVRKNFRTREDAEAFVASMKDNPTLTGEIWPMTMTAVRTVLLLETLAAVADAEATVLALLVENAESRSTEFRAQGILAKIDRLERQQDRLRQLIAAIKERDRRRRDLERLRKQNAAASTPAKTDEAKTKPSRDPEVFKDAHGRVIGYRHRWGNSDYFLEPGGKWAGRETDGKTFAASGKLAGIGRLGVGQLGTAQNCRKPPRKGRQG